MISAIGLRLSRIFERVVPDPFVLAILLTALAFILAIAFGDFGQDQTGVAERAVASLDAWRGGDGLWRFLAFGMRMCLVLVTGHVLASSPPVRAVIDGLAKLPKGAASAAALVGTVAALAGLVNWGLGLIVGALLAREVARGLSVRGVAHHYPLIVAAGYMGLLVWHGGLSGSAPLTMAKPSEAAAVLPAGFDEYALAGVELSRTLGSGLNIVATGGLIVLVPLVLMLLAPKPGACRGIDAFEPPVDAQDSSAVARSLPEWLEHTRWLSWLLALGLFAGVGRYVSISGIGSVGLDEINATMLALGLIAQGSIASYIRAAESGARGCAGIILQFPLYAGIMGVLSASGLIASFSAWVASVGGANSDVLMYLSAAVVNLFVPSGGGQWGIQGPVALQAAADAGIDPARMIMAVAYGDQLTNMLQPFWALPLLAVTGVKAKDIVGYTAIVMLVAAVWTVGVLMI
ncbi:MAG: TIGR00366 family protein [Planctomycetota bacterium]